MISPEYLATQNSVILHELLLIAKQCAEYNVNSHLNALNVMLKTNPFSKDDVS